MISLVLPVLAQFKKVFHLSNLQVWKSMEKYVCFDYLPYSVFKNIKLISKNKLIIQVESFYDKCLVIIWTQLN